MRNRAGWLGLAVLVVAWALFIILRLGAGWRIFLFLPAALAASGFLQGAFHFCANFGMRGVFNLGPSVGTTESVDQAEHRTKDRAKALQIMGLSFLGGGVVAAVGFFTAL